MWLKMVKKRRKINEGDDLVASYILKQTQEIISRRIIDHANMSRQIIQLFMSPFEMEELKCFHLPN